MRSNWIRCSSSCAIRFETTVVFVTHAVESALSIADRIMVLDAGRVAAIGTPEAIRTHPAAEIQALLAGCRGRPNPTPMITSRD